MEKYDAAFSDMENRLIEEARMIPPRLGVIEECLRAGADLNKIGAERNVFLTILEYYGEYVDENGDVRETGEYLPALLKLFFRYGVDIKVKNEDEMSAAWCFVWPTATDQAMLEAAELLLQKGMKANARYQNETPLDYLEESLKRARATNDWTELDSFREKYRALLIRYGGVPRYRGYCGWVVEDVPEKERPLLWGDKSHRAKLNRNYRFRYNESIKDFDLIDMKTEKRIGSFYGKK
ncbi:MAG: hypothetical protein IKL30_01370, partial [Anaerotignum sp.]|nr:hypothetical protein [Anaerotignum sp.]